MEAIKKKLEKDIGKPCKKYDPFCFTCINWSAYNVIKETFEIYKK